VAFGAIIQSEFGVAYPDTSCSVSIAAAVAGNLLVCVHFTGSGDSQAPTGFTEAISVTDPPGSNDDQGAIYWKIAVGGETSVAPGSSTSDEHGAAVLEIEGPWEASPVDQTGTNDVTTESTTSVSTDGATSQADEMAVVGITCREDADPMSGWTAGFTETEDIDMAYKRLGVAYKLLTATGTITTQADHSNSASMGMIATFKKQAVTVYPDMWHPLIEQRQKDRIEVVSY
jgi:hypothetical protein